MAVHKYIDRICLAGALSSLLLSLLFMNGQALGIQPASRIMGYETRLFDTSRVHTIDIVMDDWDSFIDTCEDEEYSSCAVVIDGEAYRNVGLRAKGNTSLSNVSQLGSDRYSFKIEFDHYEKGRTCHGLDKLSLNNLIQDNTLMKDYLTYRLMAEFGANTPLCSYAYITVNGQDWGLYLAVEGLEDSFLQRSYGRNHGQLYKPDSLSFGGGRGNGKDFAGFDFDEADFGDFDSLDLKNSGLERAGFREFNFEDSVSAGPGFGGRDGGMGSSDTKLQYIDDDLDSYSSIFGNAKTDVTETDKARLIQSLKALSEGGDVSDVVDIDQVLRYFVVHNFVVNGDSYTGSMVHNYYLYEQAGRLSMLPWDYNLAFGSFQGNNASSAVNDPIDSPLSVTGSGDRPMADWIFSIEEYTQLYHQYFEEFLAAVDPAVIIEETRTLIAPYVEKDPTKFCTTQEFEAGVEALNTFCVLRAQSVSGQLAGNIPSTAAGQSAAPDTLVDTSSLTLSDMGSMRMGGGFARFDRTEGDGLPAFGAAAPARPDGQSGADANRQFPGGGSGQPAFDGNMPSWPGSKNETQADEESGEAPTQSVPENGQRPQDAEAGNFGGGFPGNGRFPGGSMENTAPGGNMSQSGTTLLLLGASTLVLLAGLAIAFKFRR